MSKLFLVLLFVVSSACSENQNSSLSDNNSDQEIKNEIIATASNVQVIQSSYVKDDNKRLLALNNLLTAVKAVKDVSKKGFHGIIVGNQMLDINGRGYITVSFNESTEKMRQHIEKQLSRDEVDKLTKKYINGRKSFQDQTGYPIAFESGMSVAERDVLLQQYLEIAKLEKVQGKDIRLLYIGYYGTADANETKQVYIHFAEAKDDIVAHLVKQKDID